MATYKVIQDIEAEDKLLGPLTLRQFIYAIIVVVSGFLAFRLSTIQWFFALPFLPPMIFFGMLAAPFGHDQPSEVWLLAKVRFFLKPRLRIWNQSGIKELVTITAPKHVEKYLTKDLSQVEVRSRLRALADTIDSRGWAVKNINVNMFSEPSYAAVGQTTDRLLGPSNLPQDVPSFDVQATDDMMDENSNPTAVNLSQMIAASTETHKQQAIKQMTQPAGSTQADYWFLNEPLNDATPDPGYATFTASKVIKPGQPTPSNAPAAARASKPALSETALLDQVHAEEALVASTPILSHDKTLHTSSTADDSQDDPVSPFSVVQPEPAVPPATPPVVTQQTDNTVTAAPKTAIIELANNDDLDVATLSRQAEKARQKQSLTDEVVITLR